MISVWQELKLIIAPSIIVCFFSREQQEMASCAIFMLLVHNFCNSFITWFKAMFNLGLSNVSHCLKLKKVVSNIVTLSDEDHFL